MLVRGGNSRRRVLLSLTAAGLLTVPLAACSDGGAEPRKPTATGAAPSPDSIAWGPCADLPATDEGRAAHDSAYRCGRLAVPLDYAAPDGEKLNIAMIKVPATKPAERLGSLVFNFGGPGASGVNTMAQAAKAFGVLNTRWDLVSFDPRGVDRSGGVVCGGSAEMDAYTSMDTLPADERTRTETRAANRRFADLCRRDSGKVLPYVGTVNAAQDMDRMRVALGDAKLNYFGMSYGTQLGAVYATRFPRDVGRMVLDAPLDPSASLEQRTIIQTKGFQQAYQSFLADWKTLPNYEEAIFPKETAKQPAGSR